VVGVVVVRFFFSVMNDTIIHISQKDMMHKIYHYVEIQNNEDENSSSLDIFVGLKVMAARRHWCSRFATRMPKKCTHGKLPFVWAKKRRRCMNDKKHG
jgi:hypothetical protein